MHGEGIGGPLMSSPCTPVLRRERHPWQHEPLVTASPDLPALMARVQQGDEQAFATLYDALAPVVFGVVRSVVRDPAMSEDVTQEAFVELWQTARRFDGGRSSVSTWAITIARRRAVDRVRKEQSQRDRVGRLQERRVDQPTAPDDATITALDVERVERALAELPDEQEVVLRLAFLDGETHAAIADVLDLPLGTVKGRVRGGLKKLSGKLGVER